MTYQFTYVCYHNSDTDFDSFHIGFIGFFVEIPPNNAVISAALKFFDDAMALGKLNENHRIHAIMETDRIKDPGEALMKIVRRWPRYSRN